SQYQINKQGFLSCTHYLLPERAVSGSVQASFSLSRLISSSTAILLSTFLFTTSFPLYRVIFPGPLPTYPKSASAISPGPFTIQPMMAIFTPFRWWVTLRILAVVSWRLNKVRPQEGQEMYSVLEMRVRVACKMEKDVLLMNW